MIFVIFRYFDYVGKYHDMFEHCLRACCTQRPGLTPIHTFDKRVSGKGKRKRCICIAPRRERTSKALRYSTRSQGISQFYLHTPRSSANGMNHTCLCLPRRSWYSFTDPGGMEG